MQIVCSSLDTASTAGQQMRHGNEPRSSTKGDVLYGRIEGTEDIVDIGRTLLIAMDVRPSPKANGAFYHVKLLPAHVLSQ